MITRGFTIAAQRSAIHASPRIFFDTGLPPFALLKCLQSGDSQTRPTGWFPVIAAGSTSNTLSQ
ncbi:hypothetical protein Y600_6344 [Burkholderia pseudomallei MSHR3709]|nr:hypothetical protein Y600_6344 [Burkholderia pseudomallei MSHR3709]